jgi:hypothetical protein
VSIRGFKTIFTIDLCVEDEEIKNH